MYFSNKNISNILEMISSLISVLIFTSIFFLMIFTQYNIKDNKAYIQSLNTNVIGIIGNYKVEDYYTVRVKLKNPK